MLSATFDPSSKEMFSFGLPSFDGQAQETHLQPMQRQLPPLFEEPSFTPFQPLPSLGLLPQDHVSGFFGVDLSPPPADLSTCVSQDPASKETVLIATPNLSSEDDSLHLVSPVRASKATYLPTSTTNLSVSAPDVAQSTASESGSANQAQATIAELENTVESMSLRIKELESLVLAQSRARSDSATSSDPPTSPESNVVSLASEIPVEQAPAMENTETSLNLIGEMEEQWYCDRPYPVIRFQLVDSLTKIALTPPCKFKVRVSLLDGYGKSCEELGGAASAHGFVFESDKTGVVDISNIRFTQVSSKMGGHFTLVVQTLPSKQMNTVCEFKSSRITILSYRLFNARKLDFNRLTANDPLSKVKGIGSMYAKRFATLGINTVEHLSLLLTDEEVQAKRTGAAGSCGQVIENLRKVRGALTRQKLEEYVLRAREVVRRGRENPTPCQPSQPKREKKRGRPMGPQQELFDFGNQRPKRHCRKSVQPERQAEISFVDTPF